MANTGAVAFHKRKRNSLRGKSSKRYILIKLIASEEHKKLIAPLKDELKSSNHTKAAVLFVVVVLYILLFIQLEC